MAFHSCADDWNLGNVCIANDICAVKNVKVAEKLNGNGVNYLLNVGPDGLGRIPSFSEQILRKAAELYE